MGPRAGHQLQSTPNISPKTPKSSLRDLREQDHQMFSGKCVCTKLLDSWIVANYMKF